MAEVELCCQSLRGAEREGRVKAAKAAAGGWETDIGCGTCNDNSIKKDDRACEAEGSS